MKSKILYLGCAVFMAGWMVLTPVLQADASIPLQAIAASDATTVLITDQGLDPSEVSVSVGSAVVWTNSTGSTVRLVSGDLHLIYLPLAVGANNGTPMAGEPQQETKTVFNHEASWLNVAIEPGNAYTFTFTTAGSYPYYIANAPFSQGQVEVVGPDVLDLFESVLYIENRSGSATVQDNPSLELGEGETEDFTIEMFFYVPDLNYDGGASVDGLARKMDSYSMYIDFHDTQPDLIMFEITLLKVPKPYLYQLTFETDISLGWHHIAFEFDNEYSEDKDAVTIYLDGNRVAHSPDPGNDSFDMPQILANSWPLVFGGNFNGYIDEIRLSDIVRYGNSTYTVPTLPFTADEHTQALWHFDETPGSTTFMDASSYANDLTGNGGAQTIQP